MSRIAKAPIQVPAGVEIDIKGEEVKVKGPKGNLALKLHPGVRIEKNEDDYLVSPAGNADIPMAGTFRSLVNNMVVGVTAGFSKELEIRGVGYKAEPLNDGVRLVVGYSHPVEYKAPKDITISVEAGTTVKVQGIDKEAVGQVAAELRRVRPPEPYKGKGIRYVGEHVRAKAGKTGAK